LVVVGQRVSAEVIVITNAIAINVCIYVAATADAWGCFGRIAWAAVHIVTSAIGVVIVGIYTPGSVAVGAGLTSCGGDAVSIAGVCIIARVCVVTVVGAVTVTQAISISVNIYCAASTYAWSRLSSIVGAAVC